MDDLDEETKRKVVERLLKKGADEGHLYMPIEDAFYCKNEGCVAWIADDATCGYMGPCPLTIENALEEADLEDMDRDGAAADEKKDTLVGWVFWGAVAGLIVAWHLLRRPV